jgi:outer membrane protein OmpA-like peptidoglycan-associated protein
VRKQFSNPEPRTKNFELRTQNLELRTLPMKAVLLFGFLSLLYTGLYSQNLLLNGGFEEENICTEYKVNCAPEAWISSSDGFNNYFRGGDRPYAGEHCMAIVAGHAKKPFYRTYIRSQLVCGLRKGSRYRISFYVKSPHAILDSIGIRFTAIDPLVETIALRSIRPAMVMATGGNRFVNDSSWQKVILDYTAVGNESFLTIGNFSRKDVTGPTRIERENFFFVFIDDITMIPLDPQERLCHNWQTTKQAIYDKDERHEYLRRYIKDKSPQPETIVLSPNTIIVVDTLVFPGVLFATGKKDLQPASYALLDSFCRQMRGRTVDSLVLEGHTDNTGTVTGNEQLSRDRAASVEAYLRRCDHLSRVARTVRGKGSQEPVADNKTPAGRQQNRRVEMLFYIRE